MSFQAHRQGFKCCFHCVTPKRHPGCHDHCPERAEEVTKHEKVLAGIRRDSDVNNYVINEIRKSKRRAGRA